MTAYEQLLPKVSTKLQEALLLLQKDKDIEGAIKAIILADCLLMTLFPSPVLLAPVGSSGDDPFDDLMIVERVPLERLDG